MADETTRQALIEAKIDRDSATAISVSAAIGGLVVDNLAQAFEFAKFMSISGPAVPSYLRQNPGACLAIVLQSLEWRMSPFAVANKSYRVVNKGEERVAYESQLIHAVIEARAPLKSRLSVAYEGEGDNMVCIVTGHLKGEVDPCVLRSEPLGKLRPPKNEYGATKGSPLWDRKPKVQMWYDTSRDWARVYCPDVILGIYSDDELGREGFQHIGADHAKDVTPAAEEGLHHRLSAKAAASAGFDPAAIAATIEVHETGASHSAPQATTDAALSPGESVSVVAEPKPPMQAWQEAGEPGPPFNGEWKGGKPASNSPDESGPSQEIDGSAQSEAVGSGPDGEPSSPSGSEPPLPTSGEHYPAYARAMLARFTNINDAKEWWRKNSSVRNRLPNFTSEMATEAEEIKTARFAELRSQT